MGRLTGRGVTIFSRSPAAFPAIARATKYDVPRHRWERGTPFAVPLHQRWHQDSSTRVTDTAVLEHGSRAFDAMSLSRFGSSRYANRAKNIKNKPKINEDPKDAMLRE